MMTAVASQRRIRLWGGLLALCLLLVGLLLTALGSRSARRA